MNKDKVVSFLLEKGADPTIKDKTGRNSLEIAQKQNMKKSIEVLKNSKPKESNIQNINSSNAQLSIPFYSLNNFLIKICSGLSQRVLVQKT